MTGSEITQTSILNMQMLPQRKEALNQWAQFVGDLLREHELNKGGRETNCPLPFQGSSVMKGKGYD